MQIGQKTDNLFGEYLKPGSLVLSSSYGAILLDDANGNLISGSVDANGNITTDGKVTSPFISLGQYNEGYNTKI